MIKLLIVDDEKIIREGIKNCVDWTKYNIEIVGTAQNGIVALEMCEKYQPAIVITDIKMPHMDGLTFLRKLRETDLDVKVIVLSGYDEFAYAQQAVKNNVFEYLLKPVKPNDLQNVVLRAAAEYEEEQQQKETKMKVWKKIEESLPAIRQHFFRDLAEGYIFSDKNLTEKLEFLNLPYGIEGYFGVLIISIDGYEKLTENIPEHNRQVVHYMVLEELQNYGGIGVWADFMGQYGVLAAFEDEGYETFETLADTLKQKVQNAYNLSISVGVGSVFTNLNNTHQAWCEAKKALEYRLILGQGQIIKYWEVAELSESQQQYDMKLEEDVLLALKNLDKDELSTAIDSYLDFCIQNVQLQYVKAMFIKLLLGAIMHITQVEEKPDNFMGNWFDICAKIQDSTDVGEIKNVIYTVLADAVDFVRESRSGNEGLIISGVFKYINENYAQNLSLKKISEKLYLTPNYICSLFKKNVGKTIGDYLTEFRIEKAKELLKDPKYKLYEVANLVGYTDGRYFGNLFKKMTGMSASEYRNTTGVKL